MSMLNQFQKLDDLIVELTQPPVRATLRNQLALTREQVEAYQASSDKQDQTLAAQLDTITTLQNDKANLEKQLADIRSRDKAVLSDFYAQQQAKARKLRESHTLTHDF
jgi:hypothetical protein